MSRTVVIAPILAACVGTSALRMPSIDVRIGRRDALALASATAIVTATPATAAEAAAAVAVQRFSIAPKVSILPPIGQFSRYEDQLSTPKGVKKPSVQVSFDFPSQWTQLGQNGIQYVDGSTGLKLYVLKAELPGTSLADTPKKWFAQSVFSPDGAIVRSGTTIEDFKVTKSTMVDAPEGAAGARRRLSLKYTVITPANQRTVERFAVVDAYEVEGTAFMMLASASGTKWEGGESVRCERVADTFYIGS